MPIKRDAKIALPGPARQPIDLILFSGNGWRCGCGKGPTYDVSVVIVVAAVVFVVYVEHNFDTIIAYNCLFKDSLMSCPAR